MALCNSGVWHKLQIVDLIDQVLLFGPFRVSSQIYFFEQVQFLGNNMGGDVYVDYVELCMYLHPQWTLYSHRIENFQPASAIFSSSQINTNYWWNKMDSSVWKKTIKSVSVVNTINSKPIHLPKLNLWHLRFIPLFLEVQNFWSQKSPTDSVSMVFVSLWRVLRRNSDFVPFFCLIMTIFAQALIIPTRGLLYCSHLWI